MAKRKIIKIDVEKCNGCGLCIPNCPEGALQVIDGKVRLISDLFCDGLGACIGYCPEGAIRVEEREAEEYDEKRVMANIVKQGRNVIKAHLEHLREHSQSRFLKQAMDFLKEKNMEIAVEEQSLAQRSRRQGAVSTRAPIPLSGTVRGAAVPNNKGAAPPKAGWDSTGCPGKETRDFKKKNISGENETASRLASQLRQWPIQLHLVSPSAAYYQGADVLLAADCVAYALGNFHQNYLKGKSIAIACPKLDKGQDIYSEKIKSLLEEAKINTLSVMIMQVPCCMGLLNLARGAVQASKRKVPIKSIVVGLQGEIIKEGWL